MSVPCSFTVFTPPLSCLSLTTHVYFFGIMSTFTCMSRVIVCGDHWVFEERFLWVKVILIGVFLIIQMVKYQTVFNLVDWMIMIFRPWFMDTFTTVSLYIVAIEAWVHMIMLITFPNGQFLKTMNTSFRQREKYPS